MNGSFPVISTFLRLSVFAFGDVIQSKVVYIRQDVCKIWMLIATRRRSFLYGPEEGQRQKLDVLNARSLTADSCYTHFMSFDSGF